MSAPPEEDWDTRLRQITAAQWMQAIAWRGVNGMADGSGRSERRSRRNLSVHSWTPCFLGIVFGIHEALLLELSAHRKYAIGQ
jgi:hypothetical protein